MCFLSRCEPRRCKISTQWTGRRVCGVVRVLTRPVADWTAPAWLFLSSCWQLQQCCLRRTPPLCRLSHSQPLPFHRLAECLQYVAQSQLLRLELAHGLISLLRAAFVLCCSLHRVYESLMRRAAARAESGCLGGLQRSTTRRFAAAASAGIIEGCPSYARVMPVSYTHLTLPTKRIV